MLPPLSPRTLSEGNDGLARHDAILPVARARTSAARSKNSRKYPSPPYLTAAKVVWLHEKNLSLIGRAVRAKKVVTIPGFGRSLFQKGQGSEEERSSFTEDNFYMYECVFLSRRHGDSGLVPSEPSISGIQRAHRSSRFRKGKLVPLLLGCALFNGACADDSTTDNTQHHKHRHGSGHGRDQSETLHRSDSSSTSSPTPALGW
jgi:hypothetical protein